MGPSSGDVDDLVTTTMVESEPGHGNRRQLDHPRRFVRAPNSFQPLLRQTGEPHAQVDPRTAEFRNIANVDGARLKRLDRLTAQNVRGCSDNVIPE